MENLTDYLSQLTTLSVEYAPKILLAVIVFVIGWWLAKQISGAISKHLKKAVPDNEELQGFLGSIASIGMKILVVISVAGIVGIETTSFVGIIAAMGFAVGLALQGNLSNFAAGVMILLMKPFRVGDEVKVQGYWAFVKEIQIFHTVLENFDYTEVILPNSVIMSGTVENLSRTPVRSISISLRIPFGEDMDKVVNLVKEAAYSIPEVDKDAEPFIWVMDFETHFMQVSAGFKASQEGFWDTDYKVRKAVIDSFVQNNIKVAYPEGVGYGEFGKWEKQSLN